MAGQTYDQILKFYYTGVALATIDGTTPIRVQLGSAFQPTPTEPARITALVGGWESVTFPGTVFGVGSYVEMWPNVPTPTPSPTPSATPTRSPTPTPTPTRTPTPTPSPSPSPSPSPTPTPDPCGAPTAVSAPTAPTLDRGMTADPTLDPGMIALGAGGAQNFTVALTESPTPTPSLAPWIARVYSPSGVLLASATTTDLLVRAVDPEGVLEMRYRDQLPKYKTYRGQMRLLVNADGLETINILPLESYLRGVVPAEVPASWPIEAVKTQAVAARTYAWSRLKGTAREWDVVPTAANQVYGGWQHEEVRSDLAITATQNMVLTYNGKVISALYHAAAGGHTENSEYAFVNDRGDPGSVVAYLRGKPDVDANGVAYDSTAGSYSWETGQFTMTQLSAMFSANSLTDVGDIYTITYKRGVSGRVYCVVLVGSDGTKQLSGGRFKNIFNASSLSSTNMKSTMYYLTPVPAVTP